MNKILYVNHRAQQCGVYEFGKEIGHLLQNSIKFEFKYCECDSFNELKEKYKEFGPDIIMYNYHPATMGWITAISKIRIPIIYNLKSIHVGTIHEVTQQIADQANSHFFDYHIAADPTLLLKNQIVYKTGRLLPQRPIQIENKNAIPIIGSFGFATPGKNFDQIVCLVQEQFDEAIIRLNIPFAKFGDETGEYAKQTAKQCRDLIKNSKIKIEVTHDYLCKNELLNFLSNNTINVFLYSDGDNRGISSVIDWALASGRPLAISKSRLFRHLLQCKPSICVEDNNLIDIINNGIKPIENLWEEYSPQILLWEYENIINNIIKKQNLNPKKQKSKSRFFVKKVLQKIGVMQRESHSHNQWTKTNDTFEIYSNIGNTFSYEPIVLPTGISFNRILDNKARVEYSKVIELFNKILPKLIEKKIPEANVQQAFVFDSAFRLSKLCVQPKLLAVGSFEDTAAQALKLFDFSIDEIDPVINYDLNTFTKKPNTRRESYDVIISTSVIEHVEDDEQFMKDIAFLLKKGGYAIITCDYSDQYKKGDDIPVVDYRFYTQVDLKKRLIGAIPDCHLIDEPNWNCENPDFFYLGKYNYTFATLVFQKK